MRRRAKYDRRYFTSLLHREKRRSQRNHRRLEELLSLRRGGRLLEIGFGQGGFMDVAARYFDVHGVDISPWAVKNAPPKLRHRVRVHDITQKALARGRYAAIAIFNVLEHLDDPPRTLAHIARGLMPGGVLIGSVPNNGGLVGRVVTTIANRYDRTHVSTPAPDQWREWLQHAHMEDVRMFGEITFGRNRCIYLKSPIWRQLAFNVVFTCRVASIEGKTPA